jgi:hypothetical protein
MVHIFEPLFLRIWRFYSAVGRVTQPKMYWLDFDLRFTFVIAGWEGTAHDALILRDALERENGLHVPEGKTFIVHSFRHGM